MPPAIRGGLRRERPVFSIISRVKSEPPKVSWTQPRDAECAFRTTPVSEVLPRPGSFAPMAQEIRIFGIPSEPA